MVLLNFICSFGTGKPNWLNLSGLFVVKRIPNSSSFNCCVIEMEKKNLLCSCEMFLRCCIFVGLLEVNLLCINLMNVLTFYIYFRSPLAYMPSSGKVVPAAASRSATCIAAVS